MKSGLVYSGPHVPGFVYGLADRTVDPLVGVDKLLSEHGFAPPARVNQVHGARVVSFAEAEAAVLEADAIYVGRGESAAIRVADCVPILLINPVERRAAAVHAGWRGTFARVAEAALAKLGSVGDVQAYIGPAIGPCCYEVSAELAGQFRERFGAGEWLNERDAGNKPMRPHLNLPLLNARLLAAAGVQQITVEDRCTRDADDLHSFRRDGAAAGRLAAFVGIEP